MTFLPVKDRKYLADKGYEYEEVQDGDRKGVIFRNFPLPSGTFTAERADVLIILPPNYPDTAPDMFYVMPWLKLSKGGQFPSKADHKLDFGGQNWQRWSRHNNEWRSGKDGIWTMLKRVEAALEKAAA